MQTGGGLTELFGTIGVLGAAHPLADRQFGVGDIETADDGDNGLRMISEQRNEPTRHCTDDDVDLCC